MQMTSKPNQYQDFTPAALITDGEHWRKQLSNVRKLKAQIKAQINKQRAQQLKQPMQTNLSDDLRTRALLTAAQGVTL